MNQPPKPGTLPTEPAHKHYDIVIVGGAMYGSSVSWWTITNPDFDGRILVVERDPSYEYCSTTHTNSCIRQQFSTESNIRISQFGAEFIRNFKQYMDNDERVPDIVLQSYGYMYLANNDEFAETLKKTHAIQKECGAGTELMTREQIAEAYPFYNVDDIVLGSHNRLNEGYFDGATIFDWWKRMAREKGAEFIHNQVVDMTLDASGKHVTKVKLQSGTEVGCDKVVNASGPRATVTSRMAGIELPVEPRKRYTFIFDAAEPLGQDLPLTIDPTGIHMRTDGQYFLAGCPPDDDPAVEYDDFEPQPDIFEEKVWPVLANRVPAFEAIKLTNMWVGHYAFNTLDQNAIIGPHTEVENFYFVNGFSGHGLQQSPALGRATSELLVYGEFRALDLTPLCYDRIAASEPYLELAVI